MTTSDLKRYVIDTNTLISALLLPRSVPSTLVENIIRDGILLQSQDTFRELARVLQRPKFDPYVSLDKRRKYLFELTTIAEEVSIIERVQACRDPKDDMFLELAVNGQAETIVTGDRDLLALHPFRSIAILRPAACSSP